MAQALSGVTRARRKCAKKTCHDEYPATLGTLGKKNPPPQNEGPYGGRRANDCTEQQVPRNEDA